MSVQGDDTQADQLRLLTEIRDTAREHLALYRTVAERSLAAQDDAVRMQRSSARLYRRVVVVSALLVAALAGSLLWLIY